MFGLIGTLIALFVGAAVVYLAMITINSILNWFCQRTALALSDRENIAFTIKDNLANGKFVVYQGIFNRRTEQLLDGQKLVAEQVDVRVAEMHAEQPMVVYE